MHQNVSLLLLKTILLLFMLSSGQFLSAQVQKDDWTAPEVDFDPFYLADTRMVKVIFSENPTKNKAFFLTAPEGWIRIQDITSLFNPELVKRMSKQQVLSRYQSVYPYIVIAKSLDSLAWQMDPYNFKAPISDLQNYVKDFLLDQYITYKKIDRTGMNDESIYKLLVEEVGDKEFGLKVTWPWCDVQSMKKSCSLIKSRKMLFELTDVSLDFKILPKTITGFMDEIKPQLNQWHASNRRLYVIRSIVSAIEEQERKKHGDFFIKKLGEEQQTQIDLSPAFFKLLWDKVMVLTYADYCDFPTFICNRFERDKFHIPLSNQNIEILLSINLSDED